MGLGKLLSLEHFSSVVYTRRKVISGFGVGVFTLLLVFSLLFSVGGNNGAAIVVSSPSSLLSWFFSTPGHGTEGGAQDATGTWMRGRGHGTRGDISELHSGKVSVNSAEGSSVERGRVSGNARGENMIGKEGNVWEKEGMLKKSGESTAGSRSSDVEGASAGKPPRNDTVEDGNALKRGGGWETPPDWNSTGIGNGSSSANNVILEKPSERKWFANLTDGRIPGGEEPSPGKTHIASLSMQGSNTSVSLRGRTQEKTNITTFLDGRSGNIGKGKVQESHDAAGSYQGSTSSMEMSSGLQRECDIFKGRWVRDETKPYYPPGSCPYVDRDFNCHENGRPDYKFLGWRWQPDDCDIPSLNATDFLKRLRGQRLIFVGDSLNRNMWESLVCILRHSVKNKKGVYEISGRRQFKTTGYYSFRFKDYNCSVDFVRTPFLVKELFANSANGSEDEKLRLDVMDTTTSAYHEADIVVFNTGHWWTHEKTSRGVNYYQEGDHVYPILKVMNAYMKALLTWARWVDKNINPNKTQVVFRGYSPTHFRGGQWNSGGACHKETEPISNDSFVGKYPAKMRALEQVLEQMKTPVIYLNISRLTDYRKDAHPSIYRKKYESVEEQINAEKSQDCSHWCLPGVPDTWNELLYASLLMVGRGAWKN